MAIDGGLWNWMQPKCKTMKGLHIERIENSVGSGRADVNGCFNGGAFDIELKLGDKLKTSDTVDVIFQFHQPGWLRKRWNAGGNAWVLIKLGMANKMRNFLIRACDLGEDMILTTDKKWQWRTSEAHLSDISVIAPNATVEEIIATAAGHRF